MLLPFYITGYYNIISVLNLVGDGILNRCKCVVTTDTSATSGDDLYLLLATYTLAENASQ